MHQLCYGLAVHLRQLPTLCCHNAVAFGHRLVNRQPDGDFHPAMWVRSQAHHGAPDGAFLEPGCHSAENSEEPTSREARSRPNGPINSLTIRLIIVVSTSSVVGISS